MIFDFRLLNSKMLCGWRQGLKPAFLTLALFVGLAAQPLTVFAFEGRITILVTQGGQTMPLLYTMGTNFLRIEVAATNRPYPVDILDRNTGELTLLFPNNRSFVTFTPAAKYNSTTPPGFPALPVMPPGIGPQSSPGNSFAAPPSAPPPAGIGPTYLPGMPEMPALPHRPQTPPGVGPQPGSGVPTMSGMSGGMPSMPMMPPMPMEQVELKATGETTNLLGYACTHYELKQRGEIMEIWATDKLLPFQPYVQNQPHRFRPRMIEAQWGGLLDAKKNFPLLAILRFEPPSPPAGVPAAPPGPERLRFEVESITPEKIADEALFQPPPDYHEIQPLPF